MDQLNHYRALIKRSLLERRDFVNRPGQQQIEAVTVLDDEAGHYVLLWVGWNNKRRVDNTILHVRLHNGKIWIETDNTEDGLATELLRAGVPHSDIVLAFHPPHRRELTDFAVA